MTADASLPPGTLLAGKFRIERLLGMGAMGAVYVIRHELTRHQRALKLLHADARAVPEVVQRFLNEASAAGRVGNAHLVETFDAGTLPSGEPYVLMELLDGETLGALLEREAPLEVARAVEIVGQAAAGVSAAHAAGIIHRDLKPENLFVTERDGRPFVKILDFGVSKFLTESGAQLSRSRAGVLYGTPNYMSPEQLLGSAELDARADVFSLGVVLYEAVTGALPFQAESLPALSARVLMGAATPIEALRADLPPAFVAVIRCALSSSRDARYPSAAAFAAALEPLRAGRATRAAPATTEPPPVERRSRHEPRRSSTALLAGLGSFVVLLGVAGGVHYLRHAEVADSRASASATMAPPPAASTAWLLRPPSEVPAQVEVTPTSASQGASKPARATSNEGRASNGRAHAGTSQSTAQGDDDAAPAPPRAAPEPGPRATSTADSLGLNKENPFR